MPRNGVMSVNPYETLGINSSATDEEIKKAYRKLVRESHPDLVQGQEEKASATEKFRRVQESWECLSDPVRKAEYDQQFTSFRSFFGAHSWGGTFTPEEPRYASRPEPVLIPEPEDIIVDGVTVGVKYHSSWDGLRLIADLYVSYENAWNLRTFDPPTKAESVDRIHVIAVGEEIFSSNVSYMGSDQLHTSLRYYEKMARSAVEQDEYAQQLKQLRLQRDSLFESGRPTARLDQYIREMAAMLSGEQYRRMHGIWFTPMTTDALIKATRTIENEINRIKVGGSKLLVDGLMDGSIYHPHVDANQAILDEIDVFTIRTGNEFDTEFNEGRLYDFYTQRVGDVSDARRLMEAKLLIDSNDFIFDEGDLDGLSVAPLTVELPSNKGTLRYPVAYSYRDVDGAKVAVATIRIARKVYDDVGFEYGRKPRLTELPHDIRWFLEVTLEDKIIASGWDNEVLRTSVEKHRKGRQRGGKVSHDEQNRYEATMPPPWSNARFRRR